MKTWEYFYVRHGVKFAEPWVKKPGWAVWHSCFDYVSTCSFANEGQIDYVVLSGVVS